MRPKYGDIVSLDNKQLINIDDSNFSNYKYTGNTVVSESGVRCATFTDSKGTVFMQPWAIAGRFRRKGELNAGAFLKTDQVREMVRSFILDKVDASSLAQKYNITERHCEAIVSGNSWRHVTVNLIAQLRSGNTATATVVYNKPKAKRKLSSSLIPFIRKDRTVNKLTTKTLAKKYCVSERQIQRIVSGKAWK